MSTPLLSLSTTSFPAQALLEAAMAVDRIPVARMTGSRTDAQRALSRIESLTTRLRTLQTNAEALANPSSLQRWAPTSTNDAAVSVAARTGADALASSVTFTVDQLAASHGQRSVGTVLSTAAQVASSATLAFLKGPSLGVAGINFDGPSSVAGDYAFEVVQASAAATQTGTYVAGPATIVSGVNDTLEIEVNGVAHTVTVAAGTYAHAGELAAAINAALPGTGVEAKEVAGALSLSTSREGSAATLTITGGTALTTLGLTAGASTGTDAVISIDGNTASLSNIEAGSSATVSVAGNNVTLDFSGGLRTGSSALHVISAGDGSLADVVNHINASNSGVRAAAVEVGANQYRLQLTSTATGADSTFAFSSTGLAGIGGMVTSTQGRDAQITIGEGAGAYSITSKTNTLDSLLPGVSISLNAVTSAPVTVAQVQDTDAAVTAVEDLVKEINTLLDDIKSATSYNAESNVAGVLNGDSTIRRLVSDMTRAVTALVGPTGLASSIGISVDRYGKVALDKTKLRTSLENDFDGTMSVLSRNGASSSASVSFRQASAATKAGDYEVIVDSAATQASATLGIGGTLAADTTYEVAVGSSTVTVTALAGWDASQVASALSSALNSAGVPMTATVDGGDVKLSHSAWGAASQFSLTTNGTTVEHQGSNVAGRFRWVEDGETKEVAGTGVGRLLSVSSLSDTAAAGLSVTTTTAEGSVGTISYETGVLGRIAQVADRYTNSTTGFLTTTAESRKRLVDDISARIKRAEDRMAQREIRLREYFARLEGLISQRESMTAWLTAQTQSMSSPR